jgi:hypothetical protein
MDDKVDDFSEWFESLEGFHLKSERFYTDLAVYMGPFYSKAERNDTERIMIQWLKAAFRAGKMSVEE